MASALSREEEGPVSGLTAETFQRDGFGPHAAFTALIAEFQGGIVGYAIFYQAYDTETASRGAYLQDLYVTPEARRQGAGRTLMTAVARACHERGGNWLFWSALARNHRAGEFYSTLGRPLDGVIVYVAQDAEFDALVSESAEFV